jgi:NAD(P)-dependent dehydrogenase (short-subunit alcohol dehydrogenase family)
MRSHALADMTGRVALVTGGVRGIGIAISRRLADRGVTVAAGYSRDTEAAKRFVDEHPGSSAHQGNIGSVEDCERAILQHMLDPGERPNSGFITGQIYSINGGQYM